MKKRERITADELNVTSNPNGSVTVAAMVGEHREARTYYFATREEAVTDYLYEMNEYGNAIAKATGQQ